MVESLDNIALSVQPAPEPRYAARGDEPDVEEGEMVVVIAGQNDSDIFLPADDIAPFRAFLKSRDDTADDVTAITTRQKQEGPDKYGCPACHGGFAPVMHSPLELQQTNSQMRSRARVYVHQHCRSRLRVDLREAYDHPDLLLGDAL